MRHLVMLTMPLLLCLTAAVMGRILPEVPAMVVPPRLVARRRGTHYAPSTEGACRKTARTRPMIGRPVSPVWERAWTMARRSVCVRDV